MPRYTLLHPDTEMLGQVILDFENAIVTDKFKELFKKHGLTNIDAKKWYPAQPWLDLLNEILEDQSSLLDLVSIGIRQLELAIIPDDFASKSLVEILSSMDDAYRLNYRGTNPGGIKTEVVSERQVKMTVNNFEPDELWYGNIVGMMRRFAPADSQFTVTYAPDIPRRSEGGDVTVFLIAW
jgi:hypothetical protein